MMEKPHDPLAIRHPPRSIIDRVTTELPSGSLTLTVLEGPVIADVMEVAARANPKRGFLIVSKVLGRHLPARPRHMREVMDALAATIPADALEPIVFLGMAETATALGQGVFEAHRRLHPQAQTFYLQSSRQRAVDATLLASFEEGHSHATTHLVQMRDERLMDEVLDAKTLVLIDDECSTGRTFLAAADALAEKMPGLAAIHTCCITDWTGKHVPPGRGVPITSHAMMKGLMDWRPSTDTTAPPLAPGHNAPGIAPVGGMRSRCGLREPERAIRRLPDVHAGERILVLGEGEHSYEALLVAENIEALGGIAAVQCITRSPALVGHAIRSVSLFNDAYGSGAPCFLYNLLEHRPDRILVVTEVPGSQIEDVQGALAQLGATMPVHMVLCTYPEADHGKDS